MIQRIKNSFNYRYWRLVRNHWPYLYCKHLYKIATCKVTDFSHPKDINEKIQWLEFFTDTTEWSRLADKYAVREFVKERVGEEILVPLLGKWNNAAEIDFSKLPNKFVIKPNNGSYDCCIVTDKENADLEEIRRKMDRSMTHVFGYDTAEPHYLRINPCIIAEELLECDAPGGLIDYKLWCFGGKFHSALVCANRDSTKHKVDLNYYDREWRVHKDKIAEPFRNNFNCPKPANFDLMIAYAEKLAEGLAQVRVDFYNINGKIYFGEMTFTSNLGMMPYYTQDVLNDMGALCKIPERSLKVKIKTFIHRWLPRI